MIRVFNKAYFRRDFKLGMQTLQILERQFAGFHFLISFSNPTTELTFLISKGICFQILGPKYDAD